MKTTNESYREYLRTSHAAARQQKARNRKADQGLVQLNVWVPADQAAEVRMLAAMLRVDRDLAVGPLRRISNGRLVALGGRP